LSNCPRSFERSSTDESRRSLEHVLERGHTVAAGLLRHQPVDDARILELVPKVDARRARFGVELAALAVGDPVQHPLRLAHVGAGSAVGLAPLHHRLAQGFDFADGRLPPAVATPSSLKLTRPDFFRSATSDFIAGAECIAA
jgi:hypothetical protein